jgi:PEGA domain
LKRVARCSALLSLVILVGLLTPSRLLAETDAERLERAKALFREGNALLAVGDPERALERFLRSRSAVASGKNTVNAAICLERIGRYDEALEMYEELLVRFPQDLDEQDRENLGPAIASLRERLGSVDISANVEGLVVVDGRPRGRLPRTTVLRVIAGKRLLRVIQEGYRSFELTLQVQPNVVITVDASLEPLNGLGALRVEQTGHEAAQLLVDGKKIGALPWEGTLPTGPHVLQALGSANGSRPNAVRVLERKTLLVRLPTRPLGPVVSLEAAPRSATLTLDGAELGAGVWVGRLPQGPHVVVATERGYFDKQLAFSLGPDAPSPSLLVPLERDAHNSRWPQPSPWNFGVRLVSGVVYAPTLNGDAERACPAACAGGTSASGAKLEAALELLHQRGFGFEAALGYQFASQSFARAVTSSFAMSPVRYGLQQKFSTGGVFGRVAGVAEQPLRWGFALRGSLGVGIGVMRYVASADGVAQTTTEQAPASAFQYDGLSELMPFSTAALDLQRTFGKFALGLGLAGWFVPTHGPSFNDVKLQVTPGSGSCDAAMPDSVACVPRSDVLSGERTHGAFATLSVELGARYRF